MTNDDVLATNVEQHGRTDLAGERTLLPEIHVLRPRATLLSSQDCGDLAEVRKRRTDRDGDAIFVANSFHDSRSQLLGRGTGGVHLPVARNKWFSHVDDPR